jgi:hypothetical protein
MMEYIQVVCLVTAHGDFFFFKKLEFRQISSNDELNGKFDFAMQFFL